jgi:hypothetical protein
MKPSSPYVDEFGTALVALAERAAAGKALGAVSGSSLADAIVMASAALRGGVVYTADVDDLRRLPRHFPGVLVLPV